MANAQSEPSMDEILASIRRIISEEDDASPVARADGEPLTLKDAVDDGDIDTDDTSEASEDVGENVARFEEATSADNDAPVDGDTSVEAAATHPVDDFSDDDNAAADAADDLMNDKDTAMPKPSAAAPAFEPAPAPAAAPDTSGLSASALHDLVSAQAATKAADAFGALQHNVRVTSSSGRTIEDVVEAMLAPMLKDWLESNLPRIVEEKVEEEVRRIARRH